MSSVDKHLGTIYPKSRAYVPAELWHRIAENVDEPDSIPLALNELKEEVALPPFIADLAQIERNIHAVATSTIPIPKDVEQFQLNPTLELANLSWRLCDLIRETDEQLAYDPDEGDEWAMIWRHPETNKVRIEAASPEDLLILKIIVEEVDANKIASLGNMTVRNIDHAMRDAAKRGILIAPKSKLVRDTSIFNKDIAVPEELIRADTFTLQWHITHACDLNCAHCYDRSQRSPLTLEQGVHVLDDLMLFCRQRFVRGHVCFSGGNPFMHADFFGLYQAAADHGFSTSILGNPVPKEKLEHLIAIQKPGYFQVSLEGLPDHNDTVRGAGFYERVIEFLDMLREASVDSAVMLTLTDDNINQILPLSEKLREHSDYFTFNRLAQVGSGSNLKLPTRERYEKFVKEYIDASNDNPIMGFKDNLINVELDRQGIKPFDGCTGYGCGAAFNFIAVLPDGEAHACRKFPSAIGNVIQQSIGNVYDSGDAQKYRRGPTSCDGCNIRHACGGCLAVAHGQGLEIFEEKDPFCTKK